MAKKKKKAEKPPREFTRRALSQFQRQKRRQRLIFISGATIIAAVILIVLVGWYLGEYRPMHQTVIVVRDAEFDMDYYIDTLKIAGKNQPSVNMYGLANNMIQQIEQNELIRQGASRLGISVSDDEAREQLKSQDIPVNDASLDFARSQLLQGRLYNEYFQAQVPESAEQVHMMAMLLESESQAIEVRNRLQDSENFTALAEELSLHYSKNTKGDLGWHTKDLHAAFLGTSVPVDYAFGSESVNLSQPLYDEEIVKQVGYWLINVVETQYEEEAIVQALLLGSEEEANEVRARLEAGEDSVALAEEYSQHEESRESGGELGLVTPDKISDAFDDYVFGLSVETGIWSEPLRDGTMTTRGGYWLIQVLDKDDDRKLSDEDRNYMITRDSNEWMNSLWLEAAAEINHTYLTPERIQWAVDRVLEDME